MTREEEIRARLEKATPGPWKEGAVTSDGLMGAVFGNPEQDYTVNVYANEQRGRICEMVPRKLQWEDAELIANAPSDIDYLLKENQRLCEALERIGWTMMNHTPMELRAIARRALEVEHNG